VFEIDLRLLHARRRMTAIISLENHTL